MLKWFQRNIWPWSEIWRLNNHLRLTKVVNENLFKKIDVLEITLATCKEEVAKRESFHEQEWLKNAAVQANVDFNYIQHLVEINQRSFNSELHCAKECYKQGYGYREFPNFLALYEGRGGLLNPLLGLRQEKYWRGR